MHYNDKGSKDGIFVFYCKDTELNKSTKVKLHTFKLMWTAADEVNVTRVHHLGLATEEVQLRLSKLCIWSVCLGQFCC